MVHNPIQDEMQSIGISQRYRMRLLFKQRYCFWGLIDNRLL